jgi:hypothetical protein
VFSTIFQETDVVNPLPRVVTGLVFPEHGIEGARIEFRRTFLPNREGDSQVAVEPRELQCAPTNLDAGHFLRIAPAPVTDAAVASPVCHFCSESRVFAGFPTFSNAVVGGQLMTGHPLIAVTGYSCGKRGKCCYN